MAEFKLSYNGTDSSDLGYRPTAEQVKSQLATITGLTAAKISVVVTETEGRLTKSAKQFEIEINDSSFVPANLTFAAGTLAFASATVTEVKAGAALFGNDRYCSHNDSPGSLGHDDRLVPLASWQSHYGCFGF